MGLTAGRFPAQNATMRAHLFLMLMYLPVYSRQEKELRRWLSEGRGTAPVLQGKGVKNWKGNISPGKAPSRPYISKNLNCIRSSSAALPFSPLGHHTAVQITFHETLISISKSYTSNGKAVSRSQSETLRYLCSEPVLKRPHFPHFPMEATIASGSNNLRTHSKAQPKCLLGCGM
jgi:hypothetical protein